MNTRNQIASFTRIIIAILISFFGLSLFTAVGCAGAIKPVERFTEFYILGPDGTATNYPTEVKVGETQKVILGIINHEQEKVTYQVTIRIGEDSSNEIGPIVLEDSGIWEQPVTFIPTKVEDRKKVEFLLFKNDESEPSQMLFLFLKVNG